MYLLSDLNFEIYVFLSINLLQFYVFHNVMLFIVGRVRSCPAVSTGVPFGSCTAVRLDL